ncbi:hypothetical protein GGR57DRAFT_390079 [Xylariaceae sp. FL1272]|nr:hypothetical protein GGR57DRAFT_390079 [Xylariaceae sp. FL1272]
MNRPGIADLLSTSPRKRVITSARKEQNRIAQKAFRERRKVERLQSKKRIKEARQSPYSRELQPAPTTLPVPCTWQVQHQECAQSMLPIATVFASAQTPSWIHSITNEDSTQNDPNDMVVSLEAEISCFTNNIENVSPLPSPVTIHLQFVQVTLMTALMQNALCLGLDLDRLLTSDYISPFYRPTSPQDDPKLLLEQVTTPLIPTNLRPTLPQILYPHHPYLDLLPYPALRARLVILSATMPHVFDKYEFKRDIYINGALVCWRNARGTGQPWDKRSWEASPWFLEKWRMIVDGETGDMWKASSRWWSMRHSSA